MTALAPTPTSSQRRTSGSARWCQNQAGTTDQSIPADKRPNPARATTIAATARTIASAAPPTRSLPAPGRPSAARLMPDLGDAEAPVDLPHLHHHIDQDMQQRADVVARQVASRVRLAHQQGELLEGERG